MEVGKLYYLTLAKSYADMDMFRRDHREAYRAAKRDGWLVELVDTFDNITKSLSPEPIKPLDKHNHGYTKIDCARKALQYVYRSDFKQRAGGYYNRARKQGWLDSICRHMPLKRSKYSLLDLTVIAERYVYYADFVANEPAFYAMAQAQGLLEDVAIGLTRSEVYSNEELNSVSYDEIIHSARYSRSVEEFNERFPLHQTCARRQGWLLDCYAHIRFTHPLAKEYCQIVASFYQNRIELKEYAPAIYTRIYSQKWQDLCCAHMAFTSKSRTFEECKQAALLSDSRKEFSVRAPSHYNRARSMGWLDGICLHMTVINSPERSLLECAVEARKYRSRSDFSKFGSAYYQAAISRGWLDAICGFMVKKTEPRTKGQCITVAEQSSSVAAFKRHRSVYRRAERQGWLEECLAAIPLNCSPTKSDEVTNIIKSRPRSLPRTKQQCATEAMKYSNRSEFQVKSSSSYQRAHKQGWLDDICSHMKPAKKSYTLSDCQANAAMYANEQEFKNGSRNVYLRAKTQHWLHLLETNYTTEDQSIVTCIAVAKTVGTFAEFKNENPRLYQVVLDNQWKDRLTPWFKIATKITLKMCQYEATKYRSLAELKRKAPNIYRVAEQNNWLDKVYDHMLRASR